MKICGPKENAIDYYNIKITEYTTIYQENLNIGKERNTGIAYIICKHPDVVEKMLNHFKGN